MGERGYESKTAKPSAGHVDGLPFAPSPGEEDTKTLTGDRFHQEKTRRVHGEPGPGGAGKWRASREVVRGFHSRKTACSTEYVKES